MFTGIVEEVGEVVAIEQVGAGSADAARLVVRGPLVTGDARLGDSIAVSGCCVTVTDVADGVFTVDLMRETLARTSLRALRAGSRVNLERALPLGGRLGGHLVQGHVDEVGTVLGRTPGDRWEELRVGLPRSLACYVAVKGSIAVDGVSLTVVDVEDGPASSSGFTVGLIPTTLAATTLGSVAVGDPVNLEADVLAKYVERLADTLESR